MARRLATSDPHRRVDWVTGQLSTQTLATTRVGADLCLVAARRVAAEDTSLRGSGPDARAVLDLVRTYA